jgi:hypothetical protein
LLRDQFNLVKCAKSNCFASFVILPLPVSSLLEDPADEDDESFSFAGGGCSATDDGAALTGNAVGIEEDVEWTTMNDIS